jgi:hypothetical protein
MTRVHLVSPEVSGLINLRGQVVTAIDMRRRLGIAAREGDELPMNLVVRTDDGPVSFLVDAIGDVLEVSGRADPGRVQARRRAAARPRRRARRGAHAPMTQEPNDPTGQGRNP